MSFAAKTDYSGLARTGLEIVANAQNASNQNLEIPQSDGDIVATEQFGHVKNPHVDFKVTGTVSFTGNNAITLGKVHGTTGSAAAQGPYAVRSVSISTGAGEEKSFGVDLVQIESGASQALCTYATDIPELTAAKHAITFGAFTFTESATLALQHTDFTAECELDPTTINGDPKASDAIKGKETVVATFWTNSDATAPSVQVETGWTLTSDWDCTGSDGAMFVWTGTFTKYLTAS